MSTLLLRLAGPLQSWGDSSRFTRRETRSEPTKSGIVGLIAAAQGRRRSDLIEDLVALRFGVRVDQPGRLVTDFQTARHLTSGKVHPLSYRYYLGDAVFLAGLEGDRALLEGIREAILSPAFPLYLGRRACPPSGPIVVDLVDEDLDSALRTTPWLAAGWYRRRAGAAMPLAVYRDAGPDELGDTVRDAPISFAQERREYGWRRVVHDTIPNPEQDPDAPSARDHDPFPALGGA